MDAETTTQKLISVFLEGDLEIFQVNVTATEATIKDSHNEIIHWLSDKVSEEIVEQLKYELKL